MSSVKLDLDNNCSPPVYPGQTISGRVECNFTEQKNLRAVRIRFGGRAMCDWYQSGGGKSQSVRYTAQEVYFDAEYNLVHGDDNFSLPAGKHVYPFSYILPPYLPSSLEGMYGNVRYYVKAVVDRPWKFDYEDTVHLEIFSPLDLNYLYGAREPCGTSIDKTFCSCWCNDAGALTLNISLPCAGFALGQEVDIGASVQNTSSVSAEAVKFKIVQTIEFIALQPSTRSRFEQNVLTECVEGGVGAHGEKSWTSKLLIPPSRFSNMIPCSIINISYVLKAKVVTPCPHKNLRTEIPIFIGTVPISGVSTTFPQGPPSTLPQPLILPPSDGPTFGYINGTPNASNTQFPNPISSPYPSPAALYPGDAPYPGGAIYPANEKSPSGSGGAPYPGAAPYPSGGPSAPGASAASYPPRGSHPPRPGAAPYPEGCPYPSGDVSYPLASKVPYPPSSDAGPSAPLNRGASAPYFSKEAAPPSYSEADNLLEK